MPEQAMKTTAEDSRRRETPPQAERLADESSWIRQKKVRRNLAIGLAVVLLLVGGACAAGFLLKNPPEKDYLTEYRKLPDHEVYRPQPSAVLNDTELQQCAANCSTNIDFECMHLQFCARVGTQLGTCHLFRGNTKIAPHPSLSCDIYSRGDPAESGLPHGGASSLNTGLGRILFSILLSLAVHHLAA